MKYLIILALLAGVTISLQAQPKMIEHKVGHIYYIDLPDYMQPTTGLNQMASLQYENTEQAAYVIIIDEAKDGLAQFGINDLETYYSDLINNFAADAPDKKIADSTLFTNGTIRFIQTQASARLDSTDFAYLITCAESPTYFYRIICWTLLDKKDTLFDIYMKLTKTLHE